MQVFETWLHPTKFCTVMCTEGQACRRKVCWFAHTPGELRAPTPAPAQAAAAGRTHPTHAAAGGPAAAGSGVTGGTSTGVGAQGAGSSAQGVASSQGAGEGTLTAAALQDRLALYGSSAYAPCSAIASPASPYQHGPGESMQATAAALHERVAALSRNPLMHGSSVSSTLSSMYASGVGPGAGIRRGSAASYTDTFSGLGGDSSRRGSKASYTDTISGLGGDSSRRGSRASYTETYSRVGGDNSRRGSSASYTETFSGLGGDSTRRGSRASYSETFSGLGGDISNQQLGNALGMMVGGSPAHVATAPDSMQSPSLMAQPWAGGSSASMLWQQQQHQLAVGAGMSGNALPTVPSVAASPSGSLLQQLQQLKLQQEAAAMLPAALQSRMGGTSAAAAAAAVPDSIMPMLSGGDSGVLLDCGSLAPLSGLLSSLEEQAVQAQMQAANAQAAAATATNNLAAVLSALGVLPGMQAAGVDGSPPAALLQQQQQQALPAAPPPAASAGFSFPLL